MKLLASLLLPVACVAQIASVATTGDGAKLWLNSGYRLVAQPELEAGRRVVALERDATVSVAGTASDGMEILAPYLSADGQTTGWIQYSPCRTGSCGLAGLLPRQSARLWRNGVEHNLPGVVLSISRNGRYVVAGGGPPQWPAPLIDLDTGGQTSIPWFVSTHSKQVVADDGSVIGWRPDEGLVHFANGTLRTLIPDERVQSAALSSDGQTVVAHRVDGRLIRIDLQTNAETTLLQTEGVLLFSISRNAEQILIAGQAKLWLWESGELHELAVIDGLRDVVLSDDGRIGYVVTVANRLLEIDTEKREVLERLPSFPTNIFADSPAIPGSALRFTGLGHSSDVEYLIDGMRMPFVDKEELAIWVQVPWEFQPSGTLARLTVRRSGYPFFLDLETWVGSGPIPWITTLGPSNAGYIKAAQQNFASMVSEDNPALAGTTIHAWLTGLGQLDKEVPTGQRGPNDPPAKPVAPLACYLIGWQGTPQARGLELPFLAYAPGLIGVYQVDMTIPADWPAGPAAVRCESATQGVANTVRITIGRGRP